MSCPRCLLSCVVFLSFCGISAGQLGQPFGQPSPEIDPGMAPLPRLDSPGLGEPFEDLRPSYLSSKTAMERLQFERGFAEMKINYGGGLISAQREELEARFVEFKKVQKDNQFDLQSRKKQVEDWRNLLITPKTIESQILTSMAYQSQKELLSGLIAIRSSQSRVRLAPLDLIHDSIDSINQVYEERKEKSLALLKELYPLPVDKK